MPTYVYQVVSESGEPGETFEFRQGMNDPPLTHHPETGEPVVRVLTAPNIAGSFSDMKMSRTARDDKKLDKLGFTKYVKSSDGTYEKTAGDGPRHIQRDGKPLE